MTPLKIPLIAVVLVLLGACTTTATKPQDVISGSVSV